MHWKEAFRWAVIEAADDLADQAEQAVAMREATYGPSDIDADAFRALVRDDRRQIMDMIDSAQDPSDITGIVLTGSINWVIDADHDERGGYVCAAGFVGIDGGLLMAGVSYEPVETKTPRYKTDLVAENERLRDSLRLIRSVGCLPDPVNALSTILVEANKALAKSPCTSHAGNTVQQ